MEDWSLFHSTYREVNAVHLFITLNRLSLEGGSCRGQQLYNTCSWERKEVKERKGKEGRGEGMKEGRMSEEGR